MAAPVNPRLPRNQYTALYGPPAGARVRLGDTALLAEVERDCSAYGEECVYSAGLSLRETMGLVALSSGALDAIVTNVLIVDWTGIHKADIGIKNGRITGIGKGGNPDCMAGVTPGMSVGAATAVIAGEGLIATAGAVDMAASFTDGAQLHAALAAGVTTLVGGCSGAGDDRDPLPAASGARQIELLLRATDNVPINIGILARAGSPSAEALTEQILAGAAGLALHETFGCAATTSACALDTAQQYDLPGFLKPDCGGESGDYDTLLSALKGRPVNVQLNPFGGGGISESLRSCGEATALCFSSSSALAASINTLDEQRLLAGVRRRNEPGNTKQESFVDRSLFPGLFAAEDILHDIGAIPIISSGAMNSGRSSEIISRTWQIAHKMSQQRGRLKEEKGKHDNLRIRRFIAKYTINPAIACGISHDVGSLETGKLADVVLWKPAFFGIRPECVIKGGIVAAGQFGTGGAALVRAQPVRFSETLGAQGKAGPETSLTFVSKHSLRQNALANYGLRKYFSPVKNCRSRSRAEMRLNDAVPAISIDRQRGALICDGELLTCEPAESLPLAQRYSLF